MSREARRQTGNYCIEQADGDGRFRKERDLNYIHMFSSIENAGHHSESSLLERVGGTQTSRAEEGGEVGHTGHSLELYGPQAGERGRVAAGGSAGSRLNGGVCFSKHGWDLSTFKRSKRTKWRRGGKKREKQPKQVVGRQLSKHRVGCLCGSIDGRRDDHTRCSKSDRERRAPCDITYVWKLKYDTKMDSPVKWKLTHILRERTCSCQGGGVVGEG